MQAKLYTTREICELVKVSKITLLKWQNKKLINPPAERTIYQFLWSEENITNIKQYIERRKR